MITLSNELISDDPTTKSRKLVEAVHSQLIDLLLHALEVEEQRPQKNSHSPSLSRPHYKNS